MLHDISEFDVIFLSYDEPNAEELYADLCNKIPWSKRINGVKGFDAAHRACADASDTHFFITVDGDNLVHDDFLDVRIEISEDQNDHAWTWSSRNVVNGLVYGNGGVKLWSKDFVYKMDSHENAKDDAKAVDFCWDTRYHDLFGCYSTSMINGSPYQAFRSGFREGVKMSLDRGQKVDRRDFSDRIWIHNLQKLCIWCSIGMDVENGDWTIYGARLGASMCNLTEWDHRQIGDYGWFSSFWDDVKDQNPMDMAVEEGRKLKTALGLDIADLDADASRFFKRIYINPNKKTLEIDHLRHLVAVSDV